MPQAPYPEILPERWASDPGANVLEPATEKQEAGFSNKEKPPAGWLNWLFNTCTGWVRAFYQTMPIEFASMTRAHEEAQDWQTVRLVEKTSGATPGAQVDGSPSSINLGASSQVLGAGFDGRYFYAIDGLAVRRWDLLDGTDTGTSYAPGWAAGSIEQVASNGRFLIMAGQDTVADKGKATVIDLSDGSTLTTVEISSTAVTSTIRRVRVSRDYAWVARAQTVGDSHDTVRISLADGTSTNLTLLVEGTAPLGFDVGEGCLAIAQGSGHKVWFYDESGTEFLGSAEGSNSDFNVRDLRILDGNAFAVMNTNAAAPLVLAKMSASMGLVGEVEVSSSKDTFMFTLDKECAYVLVGDSGGSFSTIDLYAYHLSGLSHSWQREGTYPSPSTDFEGLFSDGFHLWADTTTPSNPQIRRLYTARRVAHVTKIPPGEQGQKLGLLMT